MTQSVTAIILAAGFSTRFGSLKLCANLDNGLSVFAQTLERVSAALPHPIVVTRPEVAPLLAEFGAHIEVFEGADQGMGATLAHSIGLASDSAGCLICLADMPFIAVSTYQQISRQLSSNNIIIPSYHSKPGNPVAFGPPATTQ